MSIYVCKERDYRYMFHVHICMMNIHKYIMKAINNIYLKSISIYYDKLLNLIKYMFNYNSNISLCVFSCMRGYN